jgi:hypothetical protein
MLEGEIEMEPINGWEIAINKVFCGDDGDNVPSIYSWINDKDKEVRITPSKMNKILEGVEGATSIEELRTKSILIERELKAVSKQKTLSISIDDRLDRQIKLVILQSSVFPKNIVSKFNKEIEEAFKKKRITIADISMTSILEGTRYVSDDYKSSSKGSEADIFGMIDRISTKELF